MLVYSLAMGRRSARRLSGNALETLPSPVVLFHTPLLLRTGGCCSPPFPAVAPSLGVAALSEEFIVMNTATLGLRVGEKGVRI